MQLVGAACGLVAPNQRRTETGTGTQSPPRTGCPGPTQGGVEFPRLGRSVRLSLSQCREGLPSPHLARLVVAFGRELDGPHEPSALHALRCVLSPPPAAPDVDSGVPPDTETATDELTAQDEGTQPLPGWDQDSQSWGDLESQALSQSASGSGRPTRMRRRPTALDAYILE